MHQLAIILLLGLASSDAQQERPARTGIVPNEVLVSTRGKITDVVRKIGKPIERIEDLDIWVVRLGRGVSVTDALVTLSQDRRVLFAEPHFIGRSAVNPNDPCFLAPTAAECNEHSQWAPQRVHADLAWDIWRPKQRVRLAINDTGVDNDHVDLTNKILRDEDGIIGYNAFTSERSGADDPGSGSGHGTLVAGVAAAEINNARGMAGIAAWSPVTVYPWVKIMPVKSSRATDYTFLGLNLGDVAAAPSARGIKWATDHGAAVINMSWSFTSPPTEYEMFYTSTPTLKEALHRAWRKDVVLVACAGNDGSSDETIPGQFRGVMAVAATLRPGDIATCDTVVRDRLRDDSNYGNWVDIAAPGDRVMTTHKNGSYVLRGQTSIAAPHVSGAAALIRSHNPNINNDFVMRVLRYTAEPMACDEAHKIDGGRLNVVGALGAAGNPLLKLTIAPNEVDLLGAVPHATVTLTVSGTHGPMVIELSTLDPEAVSVPLSVIIPSHASSAQFDVEVNDMPRGGKTTIVARGPGNGVAAAPLFVNHILHSMRHLFMDRRIMVHGAEIAMDISVTDIPRTDVAISLLSTHPDILRVPATTTIAQFHDSKTLLLRAGPVQQATDVTITAAIGNSTQRATVTVLPPP